MRYVGNKRKIANEILSRIILPDCKNWIEPFTGGNNMMATAKRYNFENFYLNDLNEYIVALQIAYNNGWTILDYDHPEIYEHNCIKHNIPIKGKRISEKLCNDIKNNKEKYPKEVVGFAGLLGFASRWFGTYPRDNTGLKDGSARNHSMQLHNGLLKTPHFKYKSFQTKNYNDLDLPGSGVIYCDPPYKGTFDYRYNFNHDDFYSWCIDKAKQGYLVYISEYDMPSDKFTQIMEKEVITRTTMCIKDKEKRDENKTRVEKLYVVKGFEKYKEIKTLIDFIK